MARTSVGHVETQVSRNDLAIGCIAFGNLPCCLFSFLADFIGFVIIWLYASLAGAEARGNEASILQKKQLSPNNSNNKITSF